MPVFTGVSAQLQLIPRVSRVGRLDCGGGPWPARQGRPQRHRIASALWHMPRGRPGASARATDPTTPLRLAPHSTTTRREHHGPSPPPPITSSRRMAARVLHSKSPGDDDGCPFQTPSLMRSCSRPPPRSAPLAKSGKWPPPARPAPTSVVPPRKETRSWALARAW
jgi:hypothetical protein